ncbi:2OG-Fe(II) oxygenase family protein [Nocardia sp. NPDC050175]|uniref:2OG-Fe(II) oxygenase family protein n=1 Tax=Nocardia sp. NPDC050175 TaxID=3364317 RepID=UPI00378E5EB1
MAEYAERLPTAALSTDRADTDQIRASLNNYGAVSLALSDAETTALGTLTQESTSFFDLPDTSKGNYAPTSLSDWNGYMAPRSAGLDDKGDDFERISLSPESPATAQVAALARDLPHLQNSVDTVFHALIERCRQLNTMLSTMIGVDAAEADRIWFDEHSSRLAINHYPRTAPMAIAPHRDFGGISLVYVGKDSSGLQLFGSTEDQWCSITTGQEPTIIALLGELYSYWTNEMWPAALHRVADPRPGRVSVILFHTPNRQNELSAIGSADSSVLVESFLSQVEQRYIRIK